MFTMIRRADQCTGDLVLVQKSPGKPLTRRACLGRAEEYPTSAELTLAGSDGARGKQSSSVEEYLMQVGQSPPTHQRVHKFHLWTLDNVSS